MENTINKLKQELENEGIEKVVVGAVIIRNNKVLLVRRITDDFMGGLVELPSGMVDQCEEILKALSREIQEETGLSITKVSAYIKAFDYTSGSGKKTRQLNFTVQVNDADVVLDPKEHCEYFFLHPTDDQFKELNISNETRNVIQKAFGI